MSCSSSCGGPTTTTVTGDVIGARDCIRLGQFFSITFQFGAMAMIVCDDTHSLDLQLQVYHNLTKFGCNSGTT